VGFGPHKANLDLARFAINGHSPCSAQLGQAALWSKHSAAIEKLKPFNRADLVVRYLAAVLQLGTSGPSGVTVWPEADQGPRFVFKGGDMVEQAPRA
jgi:hypothetical protein